MKYFILAFLLVFGMAAAGQTVGHFRYDTVKFYKVGGFSEIVLLNSTSGVAGGYLRNAGGGRLEFTTVPPGAPAWGTITGTLSAQTDLATALNGKQPLDADLTAIAGLSPNNNDILQYKSGAWTNRSILQYKIDQNLNLVENVALSTWAGSLNITTLGTITVGIWNGTPIPTSRAGVPAGGTANQVLTKVSGTDYDYSWQTAPGGGSAVWGAITGTLSDQTDLQTALNAKQPLDADLTTIAGLTPTNDDFMQYKAGAWANRTVAQVKTDLGLTGTNSGDVTLAGQNYLTIAGQVITANAVNLSGTHVTGTLAAARIAGTATDGYVATLVSGVPTWQPGSGGGYTDEQAQDAVGAMINATLTYVDATPLLGINLGNANTWTANQSGPIVAYDATTWNGSAVYVTQDAIRDKIESMGSGGGEDIDATLAIGNTTDLHIIYDGEVSNAFTAWEYRPSNYNTTYSGFGRAMGFSGGWMRFNGVNASGRPNVVATLLGYNHTMGGGRVQSDEAAFGFRAETDYQLGSDPSFEFHLPEITTEGGTSIRLFSMYTRKVSGFTDFNFGGVGTWNITDDQGDVIATMGTGGNFNFIGQTTGAVLSLYRTSTADEYYKMTVNADATISHAALGLHAFNQSIQIANDNEPGYTFKNTSNVGWRIYTENTDEDFRLDNASGGGTRIRVRQDGVVYFPFYNTTTSVATLGAGGIVDVIPNSTNGFVLTMVGGVPAWSAASAGSLTATQVGYGSVGNALTGNAGFTMDVSTGAFIHSKNHTGSTTFLVENTTAGTAAYASLGVHTDAGNTVLGQYSTTTNAFGAIASGAGYMYSDATAGFTFMASQGDIFFADNGSAATMILDNGVLTVASLDTDNSAPSTTGTTRMLIGDGTGRVSFANIPSGGAGDMLTTATNTMASAGRIVQDNVTTNSNFKNGFLEIQNTHSNATQLMANMYYDGTDYRYRANGTSFMLSFHAGGGLSFYTTASGTAGNVATLVTLLQMNHTYGMLLTPANSYFNFGSGGGGSAGYGFRDNAGVMEWKNSAGTWQTFGTGGGSETDPLSIKLTGTSTLTGDITIAGGSANSVFITGSGSELFKITQSGSGFYGMDIDALEYGANIIANTMPLTLTNDNTNTNAIRSMAAFYRNGANGSNGIGMAFQYYIKSSAGATPQAGEMQVLLTDATNGSETAAMGFHLKYNGGGSLAEVMRLNGNGSMTLFNGSAAPGASVTNAVILYSEDVAASAELKVRDEAGNITTLSPHNFSGIPGGPSEDMAWSFYSEKEGKYINVDMLKLARIVEKEFNIKLVYTGKTKDLKK